MSPTERLDPELDEGRGSTRKAGGSRLGELLRRARQDKGLSVEDLSRKTRLRPAILRAMEEGRSEELPSRPFVLGYLKLLARQLGLQEKDLVDLYNAEAGRGDKGINFAAPADGSPNRPGKVTILGGLAVFLLLFAAYGANQSGGLTGIWQDISSGKLPALLPSTPATESAPPSAVSSTPAKEKAKEKKPAAGEVKKAEAAASTPPALPMETPAPSASSAPVAPSAPAAGSHASSAPLPTVATSAPAPASPVASPAATEPPPPLDEEPEFTPAAPAATAPAAVSPTGGSVASPPPAGKKYMRWEALGLDESGVAPDETPVTIEANRKVWVQIQDNDGNVVKDMVLKEKQRFYIFNGSRFNITVGNAAAISLAQKDAVLPVLGPEGKVVKMMSLAEESLRKRASGAP